MRLLAVGKLRAGPERDLLDRFASRLRPKLSMVELAEGAGAPTEAKRREAAAMLAQIAPDDWVVALDLGGAPLTSEQLAQKLEAWQAAGRKATFVIGGAEGLDGSLIERADYVLSLGRLTWPHMLVRVMLAEQLFRAQSIASGHPYHRSGRP